ncbi:hypothetical protein BX600DRAFT_514649 [Xylariales sp. PMI_506]|nr:hypothetical protein BX600DRAFT_514649 [Xylariales sp. PMI_506]
MKMQTSIIAAASLAASAVAQTTGTPSFAVLGFQAGCDLQNCAWDFGLLWNGQEADCAIEVPVQSEGYFSIVPFVPCLDNENFVWSFAPIDNTDSYGLSLAVVVQEPNIVAIGPHNITDNMYYTFATLGGPEITYIGDRDFIVEAAEYTF